MMSRLQGTIILISLLLGSIVLISCSPNGGEEVANTIVPQVFVFPGEQELRLISEEQIPQNNCDGSAETSQTLERQHTILYTLELGGGVTVGADGRAKIPGIGEVGVGIEVASNYQVGYGREEALSRSVTVAAKEGTNIQHTIRQYEVWETGEVLISAGDINQRIPYSFRRDFSIEIAPPVSLGCSPSVSVVQATSTGEASVDEPVEAPPTAAPTINPPTSIPPTAVSPTPIRQTTSSAACPNFVTQTIVSSWRRGGQTTTNSVQQSIDQFNSYRPTDASGKIYANQQIPADVVIAIGFPLPYNSYPVEALVYYSNKDGNSDKWGLFLTTAEFAAPGDTACLSISN